MKVKLPLLNTMKIFKFIKSLFKKTALINQLVLSLNNEHERDCFVINQLNLLPNNSNLLDAGCGSQKYRKYLKHLNYKGQDFGQYTIDLKKMLGSDGVGGVDGYQYGKLDYIGDIWSINEKDQAFDSILCTEVFEHIPFPNEAIKEFSRLLKSNGTLILTAPSNCLRHMDPYFFYSGFSDRWFKKILKDNGFEIKIIEPIGDYYRWIAVELYRTMSTHNFLVKILLFPVFLYYFFKRKNQASIDTLCMGYHVVAIKKQIDII